MYNDRQYCIFLVTELDKINFNEVLETSADTVRRSVDGNKTFVKWNGNPPPCVNLLETIQGQYTHAEMLEILAGPEWTVSEEI